LAEERQPIDRTVDAQTNIFAELGFGGAGPSDLCAGWKLATTMA